MSSSPYARLLPAICYWHCHLSRLCAAEAPCNTSAIQYAEVPSAHVEAQSAATKIKNGNCRCLLSERLLQCWLRSSMTRFRTRLPDQGCDHQASCPSPNFEGGASSRTPAVALILSRVVRFSCSCTSSGSFIARIRFSDVHALLPFLGHRLGQVPSANPDELWREVLTTLV